MLEILDAVVIISPIIVIFIGTILVRWRAKKNEWGDSYKSVVIVYLP